MLAAFQRADSGVRKLFCVEAVMCKRDNRIVHMMVKKDVRTVEHFLCKILRQPEGFMLPVWITSPERRRYKKHPSDGISERLFSKILEKHRTPQ